MSELVAFLEARLAEDEAVARAATEGPWSTSPKGISVWGSGGYTADPEESGFVADVLTPLDCTHIARHDPARVLREVTAKRATLALHQPHHLEPDICSVCASHAETYPCRTVRALAAVYSDHPDFQEQWR